MVNSFPPARQDRLIAYFLVFAFSSGTLAHLLPSVLPFTRLTTDGLLFVLNGLVLYALYQRQEDRRLFSWLFIAYWFTFAMEAVGVATGAVFGTYAYGPTMWLQWLGVPFVIALNWCMLTLACNDLAERLFAVVAPSGSTADAASKSRVRGAAVAAVAAILTALYDVAIEPVAIALDYWQWGGGEIPLQNYLAWAAIAFLLSLPLQWFGIRYRSPLLLVYLFAQLFFFLMLNWLL